MRENGIGLSEENGAGQFESQHSLVAPSGTLQTKCSVSQCGQYQCIENNKTRTKEEEHEHFGFGSTGNDWRKYPEFNSSDRKSSERLTVSQIDRAVLGAFNNSQTDSHKLPSCNKERREQHGYYYYY